MSKNFNHKLIYFTVAFILLQIYLFYIFSFEDVSWIAFTDLDEGYLLEQLINKINNIQNSYIVSGPAAYGIEFYYLKFFFRILNFFFNINRLDIYFISTLIHLIFFLCGLYIIFKILKIFKFQKLHFLIFALSILSNPEIIFFTFNLKPDLNLLLLLFSLTFYFYVQFKTKKKEKHLIKFTFVFCASLCVKGWSLPLVILYIFILQNLEFNFSKIKPKLKIFLFVVFLLILNTYLFLIKDFIVNFRNDIAFFFNENILIVIEDYLFKNFLIFVILNLLSFQIFYYLFWKHNFTYKIQYIIFSASVWFIIISPFILDFEIFIKSVYGFSKYTIINSNLNDYHGLFHSFFKDILILKINPIFMVMLFLIFPNIIFKIKSNKNVNKKSFFYEFYFCFLLMFLLSNSLSSYPNQFPVKYLYNFFYILFSFYFLNFFYNKKNFNVLINNLTIILFFLVAIFNFNQFVNILNFKLIEEKINNIYYNKNIILKNKKIIACGGYFPINKKINLKKFDVPIENCLNKTFKNPKEKIDYFFVNNNHYDVNLIDLNYELIISNEIAVVGRFGKIKKVKYSLFKYVN